MPFFLFYEQGDNVQPRSRFKIIFKNSEKKKGLSKSRQIQTKNFSREVTKRVPVWKQNMQFIRVQWRVLGILSVGCFAVGNFAVGSFAAGKTRRKET